MKKYPVFAGDEIVGEAQLDCQGLYYVIRCSLTASDRPQRVCVKSPDFNMMLGLCAPCGDQMTLLRRVPKYRLDGKDITFCLYSERESGTLAPEDSPLEDLSALKHAHLEIQGGKPHLCIGGQSSSRPTGQ